VVDRETRDRLIAEDPKSDEILKPFLEGKDLKPWRAEPRDLWLIAFRKGFTQEHVGEASLDEAEKWFRRTYPALSDWLWPYRERAMQRADKGDYWWELRACEYYDAFESPKIMWPNLQVFPRFSIDLDGYYLNAPSAFIPVEDWYVLGILQSKVGWYALNSVAVSRMQGFIEAKPMYVEKVPIPTPSADVQARIAQIAKELSSENPGTGDVNHLEAELDSLVFDLYGLTNEERRLVEEAVNV